MPYSSCPLMHYFYLCFSALLLRGELHPYAFNPRISFFAPDVPRQHQTKPTKTREKSKQNAPQDPSKMAEQKSPPNKRPKKRKSNTNLYRLRKRQIIQSPFFICIQVCSRLSYSGNITDRSCSARHKSLIVQYLKECLFVLCILVNSHGICG